MQVTQLKQSQSFKSRNPHIRFADDIARKVNQAYPRISSTKYEGLKNSNLYASQIKKIYNEIKEMREDMYMKLLGACGDYIAKSCALTCLVKSRHLGNCHESAILAEIAAKTNGLRNCFVAQLKPKTDKNTDTHDHAVLYVDSAINPYIIDPWLGFADFVPRALERYQKDFAQHFDFEKFGTEEMYFDMLHPKNNADADLITHLKSRFPELIINK